jgi:hypothetical protein
MIVHGFRRAPRSLRILVAARVLFILGGHSLRQRRSYMPERYVVWGPARDSSVAEYRTVDSRWACGCLEFYRSRSYTGEAASSPSREEFLTLFVSTPSWFKSEWERRGACDARL